MNPFWLLLRNDVREPSPEPWHPAQPPPVDQATLRRIIAGLEQLSPQRTPRA